MASTSFLQTFDPFCESRQLKVKTNSSWRSSGRNTGSLNVRAIGREAHSHSHSHNHHEWRGRVVDENMIVLRKRIHEMKMMEADSELPREWMDWEKRVYESYDAIVCDALGHLQSYLIETRPSVALAMLVLFALSVPTSTAVLMYNLKALFSGTGIHLG